MNLIIKKLSKIQTKKMILEILPTTEEKYISVTLRGTFNNHFKLVFLDSNKFFTASLDNVSKS